MSAPSKPLRVGDTIACYTILKVINDAPSGTQRRYWAKAECCGLVVDRAEQSLKDARRQGATVCHRCALRAASLQRQATYGFMERFGSVRIIDRGPEVRTWRVVWDCCGKEAVLSQYYLHLQRQARADGKPATVCLACAVKRSRALAKEREKPSRKSRRKADLLKDFLARQGEVRPVPAVVPTPPPAGIIRAREAPQKPMKLQPMGAILPPGVMPAAIAWPRPGARA